MIVTPKIVTASVEDIPTIQSLADAVWKVSYRNVISPEQIEYMLELMYSESALRRQLTEEQCAFYLAEVDGQFCGFASVSPKDQAVQRLNKLYVNTTLHQRGIGRALLDHVIQHALRENGAILELNVNKKNPAVQFYLKHQFIVFREEVLDIGNGFVMDDFVMRRTLKEVF